MIAEKLLLAAVYAGEEGAARGGGAEASGHAAHSGKRRGGSVDLMARALVPLRSWRPRDRRRGPVPIAALTCCSTGMLVWRSDWRRLFAGVIGGVLVWRRLAGDHSYCFSGAGHLSALFLR